MLSAKVITTIAIASFVFGQISARAAGLPGDYNGDWKVDLSDYVTLRKSNGNYTAWRQNFSAAAVINGDYNGDWKVDSSDYVALRKPNANYNVWRQSFGAASVTNGDFNGDLKVDSSDYVTLRKSSGSYAAWRPNFDTSVATNGVTIPAGADIQNYINANPANTVFYIAAGERRLTSALIPKDGNAFIGAPGAILNGSRLLTSFTPSSGRWYATGQTQQGTVSGSCLSAYSRCGRPEDVYLDDVPLLHVGSLNQVGPGKWYFDYAADRIYVGNDPAGHKIETSIAPAAFTGNASTANVTIYGLTVEKYAVASQNAAIDSGDGAGWLVEKSEVRLNHAGGVALTSGTIRNSYLHHNGQWGAADTNSSIDGGTALVEGNEISFNNFAGYNYDWEAGGVKFAHINGLTVRNNYVHDNFGQGLWDDLDSTNVVYENNTVTNNYKTGILHEIGGKAVIRNNIVKNNAALDPSSASGQIVVYSSDHTEVYGNTVETNSAAHAIVVIQELREGGHYSHDNYIHDNTTRLLSGAAGNGKGMSGTARFDSLWPTNANNLFDYNTYYVPDSAMHWQWPEELSWSLFKLAGNEAHGQLFVASSSSFSIPEPTTCNIFVSALIIVPRRRSHR